MIEAAYDLDRDPRDWLSNLGAAVLPLLEGGFGAYAYYYDSRPPDLWLDDAVLLGASPSELRFAKRLVQRSQDALVEGIHAHPEPLESAVHAGRAAGLGDLRATGAFAEFLRATGARDYVAFRTVEPGGKGIAISAGQRVERHIDRRTQRLWARVAAHVAAARRLREDLGRTPDQPVDAVLSPSGRIDHADGHGKTAREALRAAVLRREQARGRQRTRDPAGATEAWVALVSGRWSLVDRFERNGRRYIVARPNAIELRDLRALTAREHVIVQLVALGKSNKLIAYELGLSESTISTLLATASRKLGASSRVALVQLVAQLRGDPTEG